MNDNRREIFFSDISVSKGLKGIYFWFCKLFLYIFMEVIEISYIWL